ncbi:hypothetical protein BCR44DRAFT_1257535 [Catenaria anguillulae PL171]|uniref:Uncharacterized protein n=1 Tax=Catenaria anguillulae PL171 TaxID=765915 RepID=A0A1Y2HBH1_9FUNG|nr:hypothetical protein BCR44DRAFT_1257535 [Catenaria anguillulae PL171]
MLSAFMIELQGPTAFKLAASPELLNLIADKSGPCFNLFYDILGSKQPHELQQLGINQPLGNFLLLTQRPNAVPDLERPTRFVNALLQLGLAGLVPQLEKMSASILLLSNLDFVFRPGTTFVQCARDPSCLPAVTSLLQITSGFEASVFNPPLESGLLQGPMAIEQRDQAVIGLYTCLVNWMIAYINQMCAFNPTSGLHRPPANPSTSFTTSTKWTWHLISTTGASRP